MKKEVIAYKNPKSPISEIFRTLRTNIQFMNANKKLQVLLVTSTSPGEGKSWISTNLAVTFAQAGKKVVIVDSDMRRGRQYAIMGLSPKPGLSDYLSREGTGGDDNILNYIQATEIDNLYVMAAGTVPPNPSELLVSTEMMDLLTKLKTLCDIVIIDGTPSELVTDSVILSRIVDSTIIVTAHKVTKKDALKRVIKNIQNVNGKIAGIIVNKVPVSVKKYGERYYYYGDDKNQNINSNKKKGQKQKNEKRPKESEDLAKMQEIEKMIKEDNERAKQEETMISKKKTKNITEKNNSKNVETEQKEDILKQINDYLEQENKD